MQNRHLPSLSDGDEFYKKASWAQKTKAKRHKSLIEAFSKSEKRDSRSGKLTRHLYRSLSMRKNLSEPTANFKLHSSIAQFSDHETEAAIELQKEAQQQFNAGNIDNACALSLKTCDILQHAFGKDTQRAMAACRTAFFWRLDAGKFAQAAAIFRRYPGMMRSIKNEQDGLRAMVQQLLDASDLSDWERMTFHAAQRELTT